MTVLLIPAWTCSCGATSTTEFRLASIAPYAEVVMTCVGCGDHPTFGVEKIGTT